MHVHNSVSGWETTNVLGQADTSVRSTQTEPAKSGLCCRRPACRS